MERRWRYWREVLRGPWIRRDDVNVIWNPNMDLRVVREGLKLESCVGKQMVSHDTSTIFGPIFWENVLRESNQLWVMSEVLNLQISLKNRWNKFHTKYQPQLWVGSWGTCEANAWARMTHSHSLDPSPVLYIRPSQSRVGFVVLDLTGIETSVRYFVHFQTTE
jgi:hypothetical protein